MVRPNNADASLTFGNIEFHANMIRLSEPILAMVKSNSYSVYTESYNNFRQIKCILIGQLIPTRYSSLKTVFVLQRISSNSLNCTYELKSNTRYSFQISYYCCRLGSEQILPSRIRALQASYAEPFEALKVAFHCSGNTLNCMATV